MNCRLIELSCDATLASIRVHPMSKMNPPIMEGSFLVSSSRVRPVMSGSKPASHSSSFPDGTAVISLTQLMPFFSLSYEYLKHQMQEFRSFVLYDKPEEAFQFRGGIFLASKSRGQYSHFKLV